MAMYLDSGILVKLLVREPDSRWFDRRLRGQSFETSELALTEVRSALLVQERAGEISSRQRLAAGKKLVALIEDDILRLLPLNGRVLERAAAMQVACHPRLDLRTLEALHLATCDLLKCERMATMDGRLRLACEQFAIGLFPERSDDVETD